MCDQLCVRVYVFVCVCSCVCVSVWVSHQRSMTAEHDRGELRLVLPKYENFIAAQDDIQALIRKYDKNGDSNLDDEELTGLLQEVTLNPCIPPCAPPFGCPALNTPSACRAISPLWPLLPPTIQCIHVPIGRNFACSYHAHIHLGLISASSSLWSAF
jgi:hypothetical protein